MRRRVRFPIGRSRQSGGSAVDVALHLAIAGMVTVLGGLLTLVLAITGVALTSPGRTATSGVPGAYSRAVAKRRAILSSSPPTISGSAPDRRRPMAFSRACSPRSVEDSPTVA